jgi:hypothetical protein
MPYKPVQIRGRVLGNKGARAGTTTNRIITSIYENL